MARPPKKGLDYFALDVTMNDEVHLIEAEHGLVGFSVLIKLLQTIYNEGYFYKWDERSQLLFSSKVSTDRNTVTSIVNDCIKWDIFNEELYNKYKILTSRRIQDHYVMAVYKRVDVEIIKEYVLIDLSSRNNLKETSVNDNTSKDTTIVTDISNEDTSKVNDIQSTQSIVKDSIEKKSIVYIAEDDEYISILKQVKNYPLNIEADKKYYKTLKERYPNLDLIKSIQSFSDYILDNPFRDNANYKSQINTHFSKNVEWGKFSKPKESYKYIDDNPFNTNRS